MKLFCLLAALVSFASAFRSNAITEEASNAERIDCQAPREVGSCEDQKEAWYYRTGEDRCAFFVYSGCGGNGNRFSTREKCESSCMRLPQCPESDCPESCTTTKDGDGCNVCACTKEEAAAVCSEPEQRGYCRALHYKWAWAAQEGRCVQFVYGGCGGNENNFVTEEMCNKVCRSL